MLNSNYMIIFNVLERNYIFFVFNLVNGIWQDFPPINILC